MSKLQFARLAGSYILGTSVGFTVRSVIANNVQPETVQEHLKVTIGSLAIGLVVAEKANDAVVRQIKAAQEVWTAAQEERKKQSAEPVQS